MMETRLGHIQINVNPVNLAYYRDLLIFLGWKVIYQDETMLGVADKNRIGLWFTPRAEMKNDYDGPGMNHLAISTTTKAEVDQVAAYLQERGIKLLFETPRHRPEFSHSELHTYYQVMFESPDRVLFEVVYEGLK
jgi:catechol 2,3-dioxygenase-like lactoylglutathione lyase family enzyme